MRSKLTALLALTALVALCSPPAKAADVTFRLEETGAGTTELRIWPRVDLAGWSIVASNGFEDLQVQSRMPDAWAAETQVGVSSASHVTGARLREAVDAYCDMARSDLGECWCTAVYATASSNTGWRERGVVATYDMPGVVSGPAPITAAVAYRDRKLVPLSTAVEYVAASPAVKWKRVHRTSE